MAWLGSGHATYGKAHIFGHDGKKYIVRGDCYTKIESLSDTSKMPKARKLHEKCKNGDHYLACYYFDEDDVYGKRTRQFIMIQRSDGRTMENLKDARNHTLFKLHQDCQGGSHYLATENGKFYIISKDHVSYLETSGISEKDYDKATAQRYTLHEKYRHGLFYFCTQNVFYVVKQSTEGGLIYHKVSDLRKEDCKTQEVSTYVQKFLEEGRTESKNTFERH